jgi:hypothetical protein
MIIVAIVVVGIAGFGYYQTTLRPKAQPVVQVGDRTFGMAYVEQRIRYKVHNATPGDSILLDPGTAAGATLGDIVSEELDRQGAPQLGISVSTDEVDAEIRKNLGLADSADNNTFAEAYRQAVKDSGLNPDDYRELIAAKLLEDKIKQHIRDGITDTADQIRLRDIIVATQADAQKALDRLAAGEDFSTVAADMSLDTNTKNNGGQMDWMPHDALEPAVGDAVFALAVGQRTQPILSNSTNAYSIYEVLEKASAQAVTDQQRTKIENQSYQNWLVQTSQQVKTTSYYASDTTMSQHLIDVAKQAGAGAPSPTLPPLSTPLSTPPSTPEPTGGQP